MGSTGGQGAGKVCRGGLVGPESVWWDQRVHGVCEEAWEDGGSLSQYF